MILPNLRPRHAAWRAAGLAMLGLTLAVGAAQADPCAVGGNAVPSCQTVDVQLTLKKDQTKGWALYCLADAYYYWAATATTGPAAGTSSPRTSWLGTRRTRRTSP